MSEPMMGRDGREVLVIGCGAMTPLGMSADASAAAVRAGIAGFTEHPFVVDRSGKRVVVAAAPYLAVDLPSQSRVAMLARGAACEAVGSAVPGGDRRLPIHIGVPARTAGHAPQLGPMLDAVMAAMATAGWQPRIESVIEAGHAAGLLAMETAWRAVGRGDCEIALVGGVDSYLEPETLERLESLDQVHSTGEENNPYGFVPAEASGFVLLASVEVSQRMGCSAALHLSTVARSHEGKSINSDEVCLGEGLTGLFQQLLVACPGRADQVYCDMNGEPYRADEYGFATIRTGGLLADASSFEAPADCWGDVGAASGPLFAVLAAAAARKRYAKGPVTAAFTASESGERCGFVAHSARRGEHR